MTYTIQVAIDGVNFIDALTVKLTVDNESIQSETGFEQCGEHNIQNVVVRHVEQGTGRELAEADVYKGYIVSMVQGLGIVPKQIEGYEVVKEPEYDKDNDYVLFGREYTYEYKKVEKPEDPELPSEPANDYKAVLRDAEDVKGKVSLTEEERQRVEAGEAFTMNLVFTVATNHAETAEQRAIAAKLGSYKLGTFLNIELFKMIGSTVTKISETTDEIEIVFEVPEELINEDSRVIRTYKIMRNHNGKIDILDTAFDAKTHMLTFKTDKFSTYALVYTDSAVSSSVETGDMANTSAYVLMLGMSLVTIMTILGKKRKMK